MTNHKLCIEHDRIEHDRGSEHDHDWIHGAGGGISRDENSWISHGSGSGISNEGMGV